MTSMLSVIDEVVSKVSQGSLEAFTDAIVSFPRVYLIGAGRSGLVAKAFAMRLVHLGIKTFVVGETVTPALREGDGFIAVSGSGRTTTVVEVARIAKSRGGVVLAVTAKQESPLASLADTVLLIPTSLPSIPSGLDSFECREVVGVPIRFPLGSLFEVSAMIIFEMCVISLMSKLGVTEVQMAEVHNNLE
ncbi:MAG: 6-phospho-3-hexuloisomerase [Thermoplasmata archaeon]|nr:MAG: 6-phospho-3-hexuloisomerase [Thermoplasmata archaeon]